MNATLYIIGNGFDLFHGIQSRYKDFGKHLRANRPEVYELVDRYFDVDDEFWSTFEARLADFDADGLLGEAESDLVPYGSEDWRDSDHHTYEFEIDRVVQGLSDGIVSGFAQWIRGLEIPDPALTTLKTGIDVSATFLNFNYTPSLTKLYGVDPARILYIHGNAGNLQEHLILGHGWSPEDKGSLNDGLNLEEADTRVSAGNRLIDEYFTKTYKPSGQVIEAHREFFNGLREIQHIVVMGHSLSEVDLPYFREVCRHIAVDSVGWKVSYFDDSEARRHRATLADLGIPPQLIDIRTLATM